MENVKKIFEKKITSRKTGKEYIITIVVTDHGVYKQFGNSTFPAVEGDDISVRRFSFSQALIEDDYVFDIIF